MAAIVRAFGRGPAVVGACGWLLLASPASALDPDRTLAQVHHTAWTAEDGAPSQISALTQTADGFLWIGSARGLFRFDGVAFERYVPPTDSSLPSHNIYALLATPDGGLWISYRPSGLGFLKDGQLTTFVKPEEIPASQVYEFASGHDGRLWAGTHDGLALRDGSRWVPVDAEWNLPSDRIQTLLVDQEGTLWVAAGHRIHSLAPGARWFEPSAVHFGWVGDLVRGQHDLLWFTEQDRLTGLVLSGDNRVIRSGIAARQLLVDRDGCLWIGAPHGEGLRRECSPERLEAGGAVGGLRLEVWREADGLSSDAIHLLFEDREGSIWAGTAEGLDRFRHNHFVPVALPGDPQALTLLPDEGGEVWIGSAERKPLLRVDGDAVAQVGLPLQVSSVHRDAGGITWWGTLGGLVRQDGEMFHVFPQPLATDDWIWEVFRGEEEGALWVSLGDQGLFHFKDGVWEKRSLPGLPDRGPSASYQAPDGRIWLGYTENRAFALDGDRVAAYAQEDGITVGRVRVIRGRGPHFWLGGELGLSLFKDGRFHTVASAGSEPFGTVSGIVETSDGSLWLNEMLGVVHIPADEIGRLIADPRHVVSVRRYDAQEGLPGAGQMNWTSATAAEGTDGRVWFATDGGIAWVDPRRMKLNELPPPVAIRSLGTEDGVVDMSGPIRLRNDTATLRIDYTALSLAIPERVRFRYRLEGYDKEWIDADTRRTAFYTHLPPGSYRFQVAASNNDGVWNLDGAVLAFSIAPAFYQTTLFAAACVAAIVGMLWFAYWLRVRQVAARLQRLHDERIDERMRIAHELHDTLLQGFLSASMQLHVAKDAIPAESPARQQVGRVLGLMDGVIGDARDAVRGLRTEAGGAAAELEQALTRIPQEIGGNGDVDVRVVVIGRSRTLQPTARDEIYRIGRESLVNALRHARARSIETEICYMPRALRLLVRDDGCGIDPDVLRTGREGHWGLSGMRERAKRMGGRLTVRSRAGSGTEIELVVPGHVAFTDAPPAGIRGLAARWLRGRVASAAAKEE